MTLADKPTSWHPLDAVLLSAQFQQRIIMTAKESHFEPGRAEAPASAGIRHLDRNLPTVPVERLRSLASDHYSLRGTWRSLSSERDQNFLVTSADGQRFILKVANRDESSETVDFHTGALGHLVEQNPGLPVPRVIENVSGGPFVDLRIDDDTRHSVYLLSYLPGMLLQDVVDSAGAVPIKQLGRLMADIDIALRGYFHPAAVRQHPWNIETCTRFQHFVEYLDQPADRALLHRVFDDFAQRVQPRLKTLRHQVIHQDAHAENVLVEPQDTMQITGLIDFGDLLFGTLAAEVAVTCDGVSKAADDAVAAACEFVASYDTALRLEEDELDVIFSLMVARNALTATVAAARLKTAPHETAHIRSAQPFIDRVRRLHAIGEREYSRQLRRACRFPVFCPSSTSEALDPQEESGLFSARRRLLGRKTTHFYRSPMHFERGLGNWLYATDGRRYLDFYNNVAQVGHCHPHVVKAIARQAAALNTNSRYLYSSILEYAERLTGRLAPHLSACLFVNSGSEANDVAWQMAKLVTGNSGAIIMEDAYHGVTDVIRQFSPGRPGKGLPDFLQGLIVPDPYRGPFREHVPELAAAYAADADRAIDDLARAGHALAAFMFDSAFCSSGVPDVPDGYVRAVEARVRAAGGLLICDEVQSGFGRMGQWWGHEHHGVRADIVTMGKPVGNGFPLGVVVTSDDILNTFMDKTRLFSTFGGNAVAAAAGNSVLDVIESEQLIAKSRQTGDYLRQELRRLAASHSLIGDVRGHGMVTGVELVSDREQRSPATRETSALLEMMRERGVLAGCDGRDANILKLRPPLVTDTHHVDLFIKALEDCLDALY
jgi:4-aminobutyrate aminotransferase-like enzyme/Ser/Thr protein kinase RdoA (MazF antagonist)